MREEDNWEKEGKRTDRMREKSTKREKRAEGVETVKSRKYAGAM